MTSGPTTRPCRGQLEELSWSNTSRCSTTPALFPFVMARDGRAEKLDLNNQSINYYYIFVLLLAPPRVVVVADAQGE